MNFEYKNKTIWTVESTSKKRYFTLGELSTDGTMYVYTTLKAIIDVIKEREGQNVEN